MIQIIKALSEFEIVIKYKELFIKMKETPQDPIHHQEGDVYTHTEMVLNQLISLQDFKNLNEYEQKILIYTTIFHDVCKPDTFEINSDGRISNPRHALKGANVVRQILDQENESFDFISKVYNMVRFHGYPLRVMERENPLSDIIKTSLISDNKLLYIFAKADLLGRICNDHDELFINLELYKELCLEKNIFGEAKKFKSSYDRFYYCNIDDSYPDTEIFEDYKLDIFMMCGLPASGKDGFLKKNLKNIPQIHLDAIREELDIKPTEDQGKIIQLSRERSKEFCRKQQSFIWNATNITAQVRSTLINIWLPYKPKIHIIYIHKNINKILEDNAKREEMSVLPSKKINDMFRRLELPDLNTCHELVVVEN